MRNVLVALVVVAAAPASAFAQQQKDYADEASEGTYSEYSADEARVDSSEYPGARPDAEPAAVSYEQQLFDTFWVELGSHGRWVQDSTYGWVWSPRDADFRPYVNGAWVYTTEGWTFTSDEPFAWAVYHYGSWVWLDGRWAWVPGYEWAPAWVSFRYSDDYIGWSPLGPGGLIYEYMPGGWYYSPWIFMRTHYFGGRSISAGMSAPSYAREAYGTSRSAVPVHHGGRCPRYPEIPGAHHASPVQVVEGSSPHGSGGSNGSSVTVYRPKPQYGAPSVGHSSDGSSGGGGFQPRSRNPSEPSIRGDRPVPHVTGPSARVTDPSPHATGPSSRVHSSAGMSHFSGSSPGPVERAPGGHPAGPVESRPAVQAHSGPVPPHSGPAATVHPTTSAPSNSRSSVESRSSSDSRSSSGSSSSSSDRHGR